MLQTLHHQPHPKEIQIYRTKWLQACGSNVCGHEVFEKLVLAHLKDITGPLLDPLQFAYRANRSVDDTVNMGLHYVLQHLDQGCQTQGPPHHFMWPARVYDCLTNKIKIKKCFATLYRTLWKCVSISQVSVSIWRSIYTQKLTLVWYDTQWFFHWWRLRGRLKGIKRTSSSAREPPTEKHDILHSFNELKKSMESFRHDFLLLVSAELF